MRRTVDAAAGMLVWLLPLPKPRHRILPAARPAFDRMPNPCYTGRPQRPAA